MEYNQARECKDCERSSAGTPDVGGVAAQSLRFMVFGHFFGGFHNIFSFGLGAIPTFG
ncbi:hypothetical protein [Lacihabitans sp. CS3-21]|uniref:hypothetical protein n=1 Tax=Lacihabitans sp. CS3-21 TaxID=2487332 RepID=UPI0020CF1E6E|nr:hypothetical protein [Lacihabitans sp. CS3-21]